ncbi:MAG: acetyl-CoA decarbonylase/synthase complex subunit gamma [Candidatus Lokiarchaeota archaeon]|nr:acetyl-CoA decarbonylase/synthase complex subunit gamma [Candidatus Lokiarchaeota archaeon]
MAKISPLKVVPLLPGTNCGECGEKTCMSFAVKLLDHIKELQDCKPLVEKKKYAKKLQKLKDLVTEPIRPVKLGTGDRQIKIGGEEVFARHELTYYNKTAFFVDVDDENTDVLTKKTELVRDYEMTRLGGKLTLEGVAIRSTSGNPDTFKEAVKKVLSIADIPIMLCTLDPKVMEAGLQAAKNKRPVIYAGTKDNWKEMGQLSIKYNAPIALLSTDLDELKSLAVTMEKAGIEDIILDPGTIHGEGYTGETYSRHIMLKKAALDKGDKSVGYPTIGVPATVWMDKNSKELSKGEEVSLAYEEGKLGALFIGHATNLLVFHTADDWFILTMEVVRQNIYADPRENPSVEAKIYEINDPGPKSPIVITTNYTMTYFVVKGDLEEAHVPAWLLVVDTEGISVESAVAGGQMSADNIATAIKESGVLDKVDHRAVIIPGLAARVSGELEDLAKVVVIVGPRDCGGLPGLIEKKWNIEDLIKEWKEIFEE